MTQGVAVRVVEVSSLIGFTQKSRAEANGILLFWLLLWNFSLATIGWSKQAALTLPAGTKIKLELAKELRSNVARTGDKVVYFVKEPVLSANKAILIKKGARAIGKVTLAKKAKSFGRRGKLAFTIEEVEAADGSKVLLRSNLAKNGKGRGVTMVAVTLLITVIGVFIKGKNVTVPAKTVVDAYVDEDKRVIAWLPDAPARQTARKRR